MRRNLLVCLLTAVCITSSSLCFAEGSKELSANGGNRAHWRSSTVVTDQFPFPYFGVIKVYAGVGEQIYMGSSAQGVGAGTINWRAPDGNTGSSGNSTTIGRIVDRAEELLGPRLTTGGLDPGYNPYIVTVAPGQEGVWELTFMPSNPAAAGSNSAPLIPANGPWTQHAASWYIPAFDVTVRNAGNTAFLTGRTFMNMFAANTSSVAANFGSFNGIFYILTKDGYQYTVNANGMQGVAFDFFVNNKGFQNASGDASYLSIEDVGTSAGAIPVHNPTLPDDATNVTHKLFFNTPSADLPVSAPANGGIEWLANPVVTPTLSNFSFTGTEGTPNASGTSPLGGSFTFASNTAGSYRISLDVDQNGVFTDVTDRLLTGFSVIGNNIVVWDGLDGENNPVPGGTTFLPGSIQIEMFSGEVHFPLLDVERNPNGIIVTRITGPGTPDDVLYWDDSDIPDIGVPSDPKRNLAGQSSAINGHSWNTNFGNNNGMDSWSYISSAPLTNTVNLVIRQADLEVVSITPSGNAICIGSDVSFEVAVRNNGPSAVTAAPFTFTFPASITGITVTNIITTGTAAVNAATTAAGEYNALLDMSNGAVITFTITGTLSTLPASGDIVTNASVMRTADVTDPDATNPDNTAPTDPLAECDAAPSGAGCNNIKENSIEAADVIANNTISADQQICEGLVPAALTGSMASGGTGTFTYLWESSTTSNSAGFATAAGTSNGQGYTPVALMETTWFRRTAISGCTLVSNVIEITVTPGPVAPTVTTVQPTCTEATGSITITAPAGATYSINGTDYQASNVFDNLAPGTYPVTAQISGCTSTSTSVTIDPQPTTPAAPTITTVQPTCTEATGSITITAPIGATYSINGTDYQASNVFDNLAPGTYPVTAQIAGCISTPTSITIDPQPATPAAPTITTVQPTCTETTGSITITAPTGATYSINGTDYQASNVFDNLASGTYPVTAQIAGCTSTPISITIDPQPATPAAPTVTIVQPNCTEATGSITITAPIGATYSINGTDYQASNAFDNLAPGTYPVTAQIAGCISTPTSITIDPQPAAPPAPTITTVQPTCTEATGSITITAPTGATYSINGTDYQASNTFDNLAPGTYPVTAQIAGCTSTPTSITIDPQPVGPPAPGVTNISYCEGAPATALTATGTEIKWYASETAATPLAQAPVPVTTAPGTFTFWASQTNTNGCESQRVALTVTVFAKPVLQVTSSTAAMNTDDPRRELTANITGGTFTGNGVLAEGRRFYFNPATAGAGTHALTYTYTSGGDCTSTLTFSIVVNAIDVDISIAVQVDPTPVSIDEPYDYTIIATNNGTTPATEVVVTDPLPPIIEHISSSSSTGTTSHNPANNTVTWDIGTLDPNSTATLTISVRPKETGTAENTVTIVSNEQDVTPSDNSAVSSKVITALKIPNTFTPDGDGINDRFVIRGLELYPQNELTIINRWGNHVYERQNYSNDWTGNGLLEGTYFYILKLTDRNGKKLDFKGYIMLLRRR